MNALDTLDAQSTDGAASGRPVAPAAAAAPPAPAGAAPAGPTPAGEGGAHKLWGGRFAGGPSPLL